MNKRKLLAPELRFKAFSDEWVEKRLGDVLETRRGLTYTPSSIQKGGVRVLRSSNIDEDSFVFSDEDVFVAPSAINIPFAQNGDILITAANGSTRLVGKHAIIKGLPADSFVHGGFMLLASAKEPEFVNALLGAPWYSNFISLYVAGGNGAIGNLNKNDIDNQTVHLPSLPEQQKIGEYFRNLDDLISSQQRKVEALERTKAAMLEKMFPKEGSLLPEIRFKGFSDPWVEKRFEEFVVRASESLSTYNMPYVEYEDIISGTGELNKDVSKKTGVKTGVRFCQEDILYGKLRPYLKNWLLPSFSGVAVGDFWVLKSVNADARFVYRLIQTKAFEDVANQSVGTKMPRADWKLVSKTTFWIPPTLPEQRKIGEYFRNLDSLITLQKQKVEKLKQVKASMLEKMFVA